jgi:hypothetical protein
MCEEFTVETELFEHKEPKPHFINPCCFGEDFAAWLRDRLSPLGSDGFELSEPIQEDYGWGLWARREKETFWIAMGCVDEEPTEEPAQWVVSVSYDPGLSLVKRLFHKPDATEFRKVCDRVREVLGSTEGIKILQPETATA